MSFKKILPWLIGVLVVVLALVAVPVARMFMFSRAVGLRGGDVEGLRRGFGGGPGFPGQMMGGWGGHMGGFGMFGGFGMVLGALFLVALFLFTVWAFIKIVQSTNRPAAAVPAMVCPNCGKAVAADWKTCPYCSTDLSLNNPPPADKIS
jgi:hypothetical protein